MLLLLETDDVKVRAANRCSVETLSECNEAEVAELARWVALCAQFK